MVLGVSGCISEARTISTYSGTGVHNLFSALRGLDFSVDDLLSSSRILAHSVNAIIDIRVDVLGDQSESVDNVPRG